MYPFNHDDLPSDDRSILPTPAPAPRHRSTTILSATFPNIAITPEDKQKPGK